MIAKFVPLAAALAGASILCGCDGFRPQAATAPRPHPDICDTPVSPAVAKVEAQDQPGDCAKEKFGHAREAAENCIHRLAYSLARASDTAETVADAVVAGCDGPISFANGWTIAGGLSSSDDPEKQLKTEMRDEALFRVVQARAGNCAIPTLK